MGLCKVFARLIHKGIKTFEEAPEKYKDGIRQAYWELYGERL